MAQVRWAHRGEAPKVYPLFRALVVAEQSEPPSPATFSRTWGRSFAEDSRFRFVVAEGEGRRIVGCMSLHDHVSTWRGQPVVELEDFYVLPEERGKGIGAAMLAFAEQHAHARGAARIELHVRRDNERAQALYRRSGYEEAPYFWLVRHMPKMPGAAGATARAGGAMGRAPPPRQRESRASARAGPRRRRGSQRGR